MNELKVYESEYRFCQILWENEPIASGELVKLCGEKLGWKPTTTYTVIKRLSQRGIIQNKNSTVTSLVTQEQVQGAEIDELVEKRFSGSLPAFFAAFTKRQKISPGQLDEIQEILDHYRKEQSESHD